MPNPALDWLADIQFDGVPGVPGVPSQFSAGLSGTPADATGVLGVPVAPPEHLGTPAEHLPVPTNILNLQREHLGTPGTPKFVEGGGVTGLPPEITTGLDRLRSMRCPRITKPAVWPEIVADAVAIAQGGWAAQAIDMGWDALHLFGWEPSADPDTWDYSLAVIMEGWPIVDVGPEFITLQRGNATRPFRNRPRPALTRFLWEM